MYIIPLPKLVYLYTRFCMKTIRDNTKDNLQVLESIKEVGKAGPIILSGYLYSYLIVCYLL
eukprot:snap_masked-scaffold_41-processed-gene-2.78-mRNA-1 protein AED:1.00 eAED:1.00 QI:0/0/0/0/1/1/2/0/60